MSEKFVSFVVRPGKVSINFVRNGERRGNSGLRGVFVTAVASLRASTRLRELCRAKAVFGNHGAREKGTLPAGCVHLGLCSIPCCGGLARDNHHGVRQREAPERSPLPLARLPM